MKNNLCLLLLFSFLLAACSKGSLKSDQKIIREYLDDNNIIAEEHTSGLFYTFEDEGEGEETPSLFSNVEVKYKGYLTDGTVFDQTEGDNTVSFNLRSVILGWQEGLMLYKKGAKGTLFIPSVLGYGANPPPCIGPNCIPKNAVLIFDVEMIDFQ